MCFLNGFFSSGFVCVRAAADDQLMVGSVKQRLLSFQVLSKVTFTRTAKSAESGKECLELK